MKFFRSFKERLLASKLYRRIFKNLSISLIGMAGGLVMSLARVSFLTKNLSVADYGKVLITIELFTFLISFLEIRVQDVLFSYFPRLKKEKKIQELRGIIWICIAASLFLGIVVGMGLFVYAEWIAITLYDDSSLGALIRIYSVTTIVSAFNSFYTAILRINNRFSSIVKPSLVGTALDLILVVVMWYGFGYLTIEMAVFSTTVNVLVTSIPPLIIAFKLIGKFHFSFSNIKNDIASLKPMSKEVKHMFFHSNLAGYLKLTEGSGGFLLGVFSNPTQVALFGLAQKLIKPLNTFKNNIQTAITPEVHTLYAHQEYEKLDRLVKRFVITNVAMGLVFLIGIILFIKPFIVLFARPEYLEALPNLYIQLSTLLLVVPFMILFPLTVTMNEIKRLNISKGISFIFLIVAVFFGLNAVTLATARLLGAFTNRVLSDYMVYKRFLNEKAQHMKAKTLNQ
jgi:O-antigen/teichoic acid export membrane protein